MQLLHRAAEDGLDLLDRVVVVLALRFARPLSRICPLALDDLGQEDGQLSPSRSPCCFVLSPPDGRT